MSRLVAIVGRPNVGKSTFFNRLIGERRAIVDDVSGVTRDRIYGECTWNGEDISVVDTGGYVKHSTELFEEKIKDQVRIAIEETDVIVYIADVTSCVIDQDSYIVRKLREIEDPAMLVVT